MKSVYVFQSILMMRCFVRGVSNIMPFLSEKQKKWMYENRPDIAKKWEQETSKGRKLPIRVKKNK